MSNENRKLCPLAIIRCIALKRLIKLSSLLFSLMMIRSRLAPTPSGYLHIGNAINFVISWLWVRKENGSLRLRIDDLVATHIKAEQLEDIFRTLEWLGLDWDDGPQTPDEQIRIYSQSFRIERYNNMINAIIQKSEVFACTCSRKYLKSTNEPIEQLCHCRTKHIPLSQPDYSLRIVTPQN